VAKIAGPIRALSCQEFPESMPTFCGYTHAECQGALRLAFHKMVRGPQYPAAALVMFAESANIPPGCRREQQLGGDIGGQLQHPRRTIEPYIGARNPRGPKYNH